MSFMFKSDRAKSLFSSYLIIYLDNFGMSLVFILFAPLILDPKFGMIGTSMSLEMRNLVLGILLAVFPLAQFFGAPFFGDLADKSGRKKALYLTVWGTTIGYLLSGVAIACSSLTFLLLSRLITGFFAGNLSICLAVIADLSPNEKTRAKNFGLVTVMLGLSWPLAMLAGGYLSDPSLSSFFSPELPFWLTAFFSLLSLLTIKYLFIETHAKRGKMALNLTKAFSDVAHALKIKPLRPYLSLVLLWTLGWVLSVQWYPPYVIQRFSVSQQQAAIGMVVQGLSWTIGGSLLNPLLLKKFSTFQVALLTFMSTAFFLFIAAFCTDFFVFTAVYILATVTAPIAFSTSTHLVSVSAPSEIQGVAMGLSQSMFALGAIFVPLLGGMLGQVSLQLFYPTSTLFLLIAFFVLFKRRKKGYAL